MTTTEAYWFGAPPFSVMPLPRELYDIDDPWQLIIDTCDDGQRSDMPVEDAARYGRLSFASVDENSRFLDAASPITATQMSLEEILFFARDQAKIIDEIQNYAKDRVFVINAERTLLVGVTGFESDIALQGIHKAASQ